MDELQLQDLKNIEAVDPLSAEFETSWSIGQFTSCGCKTKGQSSKT
jgi:hypothetical protein